MSANYNPKTGPQPAGLRPAVRPAQLLAAQPAQLLAGSVERATLVDVVLSAAAAITAGNEACVREFQSEAAAALERTTARVKAAQANVLGMQEDAREAHIRAIEQERRRLAALHGCRLDARVRAITDAAALVAARQVVADAEATARNGALTHQQQEREKQVDMLDITLRETRLTREIQLAAAPPPPPPRADPIEAEVRCVVREASHDLVSTDTEHLYHAYAGCHYLAARLLRVPHTEAEAATYETVLLRRRVQPIRLAEAQAFQRRYDALQATIEAHRAGDRSAAAEQEKVRAQLTVEQLRKETEELRLRGLEQVANAIRPDEYETTQ